MAMAPVAYCLWQRFLRFDPEDPIWPNRDRFVLSNGHASMLLYSILYLTGVKAVNPQYERLGTPSVTLDDTKHFRQLDSKCPGHPEYRWTSGVETTTGPLGQGLATGEALAIAGRWLGQHLKRPDVPLFHFDVYSPGGDAASWRASRTRPRPRGHLKLSNCAGSTTTTTSRSRTHRARLWRLKTFSAMAERDPMATPMTRHGCAFRVFNTRPAHGHRRQPHRLWRRTSRTPGGPRRAPGEEEIRLTRRTTAGGDAKFLVPDVPSISSPSSPARRRARPGGEVRQ